MGGGSPLSRPAEARDVRSAQCACAQASGFEAMWLGHVLVVGQLRGRRGLHAHAMAAGALDNVGARAANTGQPGSTSSPSRLKHVLPS